MYENQSAIQCDSQCMTYLRKVRAGTTILRPVRTVLPYPIKKNCIGIFVTEGF